MKIQFQSTIDEAVECKLRQFKKVFTPQKFLLEVLLTVPILSFLVYYIIPDTVQVKLIYALIIAVAYISLFWFPPKSYLRKRLRKILIRKFGTDQPMPCEYECTDTALIFRGQNTEVQFNWDGVSNLSENQDDFSIFSKKAGLAILYDKYFESPDEKEQWLVFAKNKLGC